MVTRKRNFRRVKIIIFVLTFVSLRNRKKLPSAARQSTSTVQKYRICVVVDYADKIHPVHSHYHTLKPVQITRTKKHFNLAVYTIYVCTTVSTNSMLENHCNWKQLGGYSTLVKPYQLDRPVLSSHFNSAVQYCTVQY